MQIYVHHNNEQLGPFTEDELKAQFSTGAINAQDHVWWQGQKDWVPLIQTPFASIVGGGLPATRPAIPPLEMAAPVEGRTSGLAITSLVCAIIGIGFAPLLLVAVICGHIALGQMKRDPSIKGRGLALGGVITGYAVMALVVVSVIAISVLIALGNQVKDTFQTIQSQVNEAQLTNSADQNATTPDQSTNAPAQTPPTPMPATPDQSTNSAPASTNAPDQSTNSAPAPAVPAATPDMNTNSAPAPAPSTNPPPASSPTATPTNQ